MQVDRQSVQFKSCTAPGACKWTQEMLPWTEYSPKSGGNIRPQHSGTKTTEYYPIKFDKDKKALLK